jgi:ATP-dependent DNA ligase
MPYVPEPVCAQPPVLARLESRLPIGERWRYEPKLDGFRGRLWHRTAATVQLLSRNGRDLGPWFPELVQAGHTLPPCTLLDGEIVIADEPGRVEFGARQARLTVERAHVARTAAERPAVLIVFDVLELGGDSVAATALWTNRCANVEPTRAAPRWAASVPAAHRANR